MAFFCEKTGVRICAPGVSAAIDPANGAPLYDENEACDAAEHAALLALRAERMHEDEASPSGPAMQRARDAAKAKLAGKSPAKPIPAKPDDKHEPRTTGGGRKPVEPKPETP